MATTTHSADLAAGMTTVRKRLWERILRSSKTPIHADLKVENLIAASGLVVVSLSSAEAHRIVRRGISSDVLEPLGELLDMGPTVLAPLIGVDRTTARRYQTGGHDLPSHSAETVLHLAELEALAEDTFETEADALGWLKRPHPLLDGETPLQAAATSYGAQRVREILVAVKHGGVV